MAALAGAIGGPLVGIAGIVFGWLNSKDRRETSMKLAGAQRAHDRELARDARLFGELRSAYVRLTEFLLIMSAVVERTHPMMGPLPDPPEPPSDREIWAL